jgi:hypothetical protein
MPRRRERIPSRREAPAQPARRGRPQISDAALVLALQRTVGNAATRRAIARDDGSAKQAPTAPVFNLVIVDDGKSGVEEATMKAALDEIQGEFKKVLSSSTVDAVKAGFNIQKVAKLEPGKPRDLGKRSFIVVLMRGKDSKGAYDLATEHVDLDQRQRKEEEAHIRDQITAEGGVNLEVLPGSPRRTSQSIAFVSTDRPVKMQKDKEAGPAMAGQLLGDVMLHELAHAMGHPDHDKEHGGIMSEARVIDSTGKYVADHFSKESAKLVRERLEKLATKF